MDRRLTYWSTRLGPPGRGGPPSRGRTSVPAGPAARPFPAGVAATGIVVGGLIGMASASTVLDLPSLSAVTAQAPPLDPVAWSLSGAPTGLPGQTAPPPLPGAYERWMARAPVLTTVGLGALGSLAATAFTAGLARMWRRGR